jgi:hypothetical protein
LSEVIRQSSVTGCYGNCLYLRFTVFTACKIRQSLSNCSGIFKQPLTKSVPMLGNTKDQRTKSLLGLHRFVGFSCIYVVLQLESYRFHLFLSFHWTNSLRTLIKRMLMPREYGGELLLWSVFHFLLGILNPYYYIFEQLWYKRQAVYLLRITKTTVFDE